MKQHTIVITKQPDTEYITNGHSYTIFCSSKKLIYCSPLIFKNRTKAEEGALKYCRLANITNWVMTYTTKNKMEN